MIQIVIAYFGREPFYPIQCEKLPLEHEVELTKDFEVCCYPQQLELWSDGGTCPLILSKI